MGAAKDAQRRNVLISVPRSASNMLVRILNREEQGVQLHEDVIYFFLPTLKHRWPLQGRPASQWTDEEKKNLEEVEKACSSKLEDYFDKASEENQLVFWKEHALMFNHPYIESEAIHGQGSAHAEDVARFNRVMDPNGTRSALNKTSVPDEFLRTWKPAFLIRHPAMVLPSYLRAMRLEAMQREGCEPNPIELACMTWTRSLYEFFDDARAADEPHPIILEADDIITSPELVTKYAEMIGLDPTKLRFTWEKASKDTLESMSAVYRHMLGSLNESDKVDKGKLAGDVDISAEAEKWRTEFGEEIARKLEGWVRAAMPDYEYLKSKRLRLDT